MSTNLDKPAYFITFTYDEEHNPFVVDKPTAQLLKKRFGYHIGLGCKSILCGEYGEQSGRPHYHMCVWIEPGFTFDYNCGNNDSDAYNPPDYLWPYGKIDVRPLTPERIAYTCGYEMKNGKVKARDRKGPGGQYMPFTLMSHGIAKEYAEKFGKRDMALGYTPMKGYKKSVSRYIQTHSGHCETYCKIWRMRKNKDIDWKFDKSLYGTADMVEAFKAFHPGSAMRLPEKILLHVHEKDDIIQSAKKRQKGLTL